MLARLVELEWRKILSLGHATTHLDKALVYIREP